MSTTETPLSSDRATAVDVSVFRVQVRTSDRALRYLAQAESSMSAYQTAAEAQGDALCGITVTPA